MTNSPVPANSLTPCPFGGNPKVAAQMGFPSCGIARPGPFFNDLNLAKPTSGGRKSRRGGTDEPVVASEPGVPPVEAPATNKPPVTQSPPKPQCPQDCIAKGCGKRNFLHKIFGTGGGRKSRRGGTGCGSYGKKKYAGRKSRRGSGHCASHGKKKMHGGRKSRRGGLARVGSRGKGKWKCVVYGSRCTRVKRSRKSRR